MDNLKSIYLRLLEDKSCSSYERCYNDAIKNDKHFVPCYFCNGGRLVQTTFQCPKCDITFSPDNDLWIFQKVIDCPFCYITIPLLVYLNKDLQIIGIVNNGQSINSHPEA